MEHDFSIRVNPDDIKFGKDCVVYENPHLQIDKIEMKPEDIFKRYEARRKEMNQTVTNYIMKKNKYIPVVFVYKDGEREIIGSGNTNSFGQEDLQFLDLLGPNGLKQFYLTLQDVVNYKRNALKIRARGTPGKRQFNFTDISIVPVENILPYLPMTILEKHKELSRIEEHFLSANSKTTSEPLGNTYDSRILEHDIGLEGLEEAERLLKESGKNG